MPTNTSALKTSARGPAGNSPRASPSPLRVASLISVAVPATARVSSPNAWLYTQARIDRFGQFAGHDRRRPRKANPNRTWQVGDIAGWAVENVENFDVVFSNAALQWVGDHAKVFGQLLNRVAPDGALAIEMPGNFHAPAHQVMRDLAASRRWSRVACK